MPKQLTRSEKAQRPDLYIFNPDTNRYVLRTTSTGKRLIKLYEAESESESDSDSDDSDSVCSDSDCSCCTYSDSDCSDDSDSDSDESVKVTKPSRKRG